MTHPYWYGMLCADNAEAMFDRIRQMLDGKWYTFVTANSYSETDWKFSAVDVRAACRLVEPPRMTTRTDGWMHFSFQDQSYVWGLHTRAKTEQAAREGSIHDKVRLSFDRKSGAETLTIDHYAPAGYALQWIVAIEDHTE